MPDSSNSLQEHAAGPRLRQLQECLHALRSHRRMQLTAIAFIWALLPPIVILFSAATLDIFVKLGTTGRYLSCSLFVLSALAALYYVVRTSLQKQSDAAMAVLLEKAHPETNNTIINAVQLASDNNTPPLIVEAVLAENPVNPELVKASELYPRSLLSHLLIALPCMALLIITAFLASPQRMSVALRRILNPASDLLPYTNTIIVSLVPKNALVPRGETITVTAKISGNIPQDALLEWTPSPDTRPESYKMERQNAEDGSPEAVFSFVSPAIFDNARFRLHAGDTSSNWQNITVCNPPGLLRWEAAIAPPAYTGIPNFKLQSTDEKHEIIGGSMMRLAGKATRPVVKAELFQNDTLIASSQEDAPTDGFKFDAAIGYGGALKIKLTTAEGSGAENPLPIAIIADKQPTVHLVDTPLKISIAPEQSFAIVFQASDDFGIARVGLDRLLENDSSEEIRVVEMQEKCRRFQGRFSVETTTFNRNEELRFRVWVEDETKTARVRRGLSPIVHVTFLQPEDSREQRKQQTQKAAATIASILKMQKDALKDTSLLTDQAVTGKMPSDDRLDDIHGRQQKIRETTIELLEYREALGGLGDIIAGLVNQEMQQAIEAFDDVRKATQPQVVPLLKNCVNLQTKIVAALGSLNLDSLSNEQDHQEKADIFAALQNLIKHQRTALKDVLDAKAGQKVELAPLAHNQDQIALGILAFQDKCLQSAQNRAGDDFAVQLRKAHDAIDNEKAYDKALAAAEAIEEEELDNAIPQQGATLAALGKALELLNQWRLGNFKKTVADVRKLLDETKLKLDEMEKKQAGVTSIVREIKANANADDEQAKEQFDKAVKEHEEMLDMIEKVANDLYTFPELPLCNELNSKMREVYEDVMQALDSEKLEAVEIAVQKEDSIMDAIRNTKERIEDVEMWLPDFPDHFVWNMETFDTDEIPDIPLVELPEELEDIVGELLEQDSQIDAQSQDTTSNNIIADAEMGWAVMDGTMPTFSAKGKTGNTRPNDNEMTGRSGSGREGQATGELVENHVKGYEGRETHARRTADQFQKGMVTEDEDSTLKARATGGGKLGGESEAIGMFGNAPRRDLHTGSHGKTPKELRKETEALYASARMLYINTGNLGEAVRELRSIENQPPDMKDLGNVRRRVLRHLTDTQAAAETGAVIPLPVTHGSKAGGQAAADTDLEKLSDEYKPLINNYYKSLD